MKSKVRNKSKKIVLIIVAVVLLIGIAAFFTWQNLQPKTNDAPAVNTNKEVTPEPAPKPEPTDIYEGWGTYTSTRDGYTLRYPANWIVINETAVDGPYIRNMAFTGGAYPEGYINLRVLKDVGTVSGSTLSPKEWYAALGVSTVEKGPVTFTPDVVQAYTFNGYTAKKAKSVFHEVDEDIFILQGDALYEINMYPYGATEIPEVQKILDSFEIR